MRPGGSAGIRGKLVFGFAGGSAGTARELCNDSRWLCFGSAGGSADADRGLRKDSWKDLFWLCRALIFFGNGFASI